MVEDLFFRLLSLIEQLGIGLSILACFTVAFGAGVMWTPSATTLASKTCCEG